MSHLVKWEIVSHSQEDGGLGLGGLRNRNLALLAKWGNQFMNEENALWTKVVKSIHGSSNFNWHTVGKVSASLRSPWISSSRSWLKVDVLVVFKLGNGCRIAFWLDSWLDNIPLKICLFNIVLKPNGSVLEHWDSSSSSWSIFFKRVLKEC